MDNKEIKFRQFYKGRFHYWGYLNHGFECPLANADAQGIESQQFVKRKDKNSKEIYVGDVIRWKIKGYKMSGYPSPNIGWEAPDETHFVLIKDITHVPGFEAYTGVGSIPRESTIEVIGNVCENPELIEGDIK